MNENPAPSRKNKDAQKMSTFSKSLGQYHAWHKDQLKNSLGCYIEVPKEPESTVVWWEQIF